MGWFAGKNNSKGSNTSSSSAPMGSGGGLLSRLSKKKRETGAFPVVEDFKSRDSTHDDSEGDGVALQQPPNAAAGAVQSRPPNAEKQSLGKETRVDGKNSADGTLLAPSQSFPDDEIIRVPETPIPQDKLNSKPQNKEAALQKGIPPVESIYKELFVEPDEKKDDKKEKKKEKMVQKKPAHRMAPRKLFEDYDDDDEAVKTSTNVKSRSKEAEETLLKEMSLEQSSSPSIQTDSDKTPVEATTAKAASVPPAIKEAKPVQAETRESTTVAKDDKDVKDTTVSPAALQEETLERSSPLTNNSKDTASKEQGETKPADDTALMASPVSDKEAMHGATRAEEKSGEDSLATENCSDTLGSNAAMGEAHVEEKPLEEKDAIDNDPTLLANETKDKMQAEEEKSTGEISIAAESTPAPPVNVEEKPLEEKGANDSDPTPLANETKDEMQAEEGKPTGEISIAAESTPPVNVEEKPLEEKGANDSDPTPLANETKDERQAEEEKSTGENSIAAESTPAPPMNVEEKGANDSDPTPLANETKDEMQAEEEKPTGEIFASESTPAPPVNVEEKPLEEKGASDSDPTPLANETKDEMQAEEEKSTGEIFAAVGTPAPPVDDAENGGGEEKPAKEVKHAVPKSPIKAPVIRGSKIAKRANWLQKSAFETTTTPSSNSGTTTTAPTRTAASAKKDFWQTKAFTESENSSAGGITSPTKDATRDAILKKRAWLEAAFGESPKSSFDDSKPSKDARQARKEAVERKKAWLQSAFTPMGGGNMPEEHEEAEMAGQKDVDAVSDNGSPERRQRVLQVASMGEASEDYPSKSSREVYYLDKSDDPYEWAYDLWYRKGLMAWRPSSHASVEAEGPVARSRSVAIHSRSIAVHGNEKIIQDADGLHAVAPSSVDVREAGDPEQPDQGEELANGGIDEVNGKQIEAVEENDGKSSKTLEEPRDKLSREKTASISVAAEVTESALSSNPESIAEESESSGAPDESASVVAVAIGEEAQSREHESISANAAAKQAAVQQGIKASEGNSSRPCDKVYYLDKSGDPYEWAYDLWYRKGLLEWRPSSRAPVEAEGSVARSHSVAVQSLSTAVHVDDEIVEDAETENHVAEELQGQVPVDSEPVEKDLSPVAVVAAVAASAQSSRPEPLTEESKSLASASEEQLASSGGAAVNVEEAPSVEDELDRANASGEEVVVVEDVLTEKAPLPDDGIMSAMKMEEQATCEESATVDAPSKEAALVHNEPEIASESDEKPALTKDDESESANAWAEKTLEDELQCDRNSAEETHHVKKEPEGLAMGEEPATDDEPDAGSESARDSASAKDDSELADAWAEKTLEDELVQSDNDSAEEEHDAREPEGVAMEEESATQDGPDIATESVEGTASVNDEPDSADAWVENALEDELRSDRDSAEEEHHATREPEGIVLEEKPATETTESVQEAASVKDELDSTDAWADKALEDELRSDKDSAEEAVEDKEEAEGAAIEEEESEIGESVDSESQADPVVVASFATPSSASTKSKTKEIPRDDPDKAAYDAWNDKGLLAFTPTYVESSEKKEPDGQYQHRESFAVEEQSVSPLHKLREKRKTAESYAKEIAQF